MEEDVIFNVIFINSIGSETLITIKSNSTVEDLINLYLKKKEKENLMVDNIENIYFIYNGKNLKYKNNTDKIYETFQNCGTVTVCRLDYGKNTKDINNEEVIKDSIYTCVYKALYGGKEVAIKKIKKEQLKEDIKENRVIDELDEEDFLEEIKKFNRELEIMQKCHCENSVEIFDYFDTEKYFIIIMELCDNNLFKELAKTKSGFSVEKIKEILLQLNNVFKIMNENKIVHRDIKLHNILIKYTNKEKKEFKVLLSDYGVSNQIGSLTGNFKTHAGTQIIMAPEILKGEKYNNKCDLWSLGVNIFQLYTKKPPYSGSYDNVILKQIDKKGQTVLNTIKDETLKDLLSKLLVKNPKDRISWEEYFDHEFFK